MREGKITGLELVLNLLLENVSLNFKLGFQVAKYEVLEVSVGFR